MNILQIDEILLKVLKFLDIDSIWSFLLINNPINNKISKYYENNDIIFNDIPLFRPCNNISKYLTHYKSFVSGENFPEEPLWLFNCIDDPKYIEDDGKYIKLENGRFDKPKFFTYFTSYQFLPFKGRLHHWKILNKEQKYLAWCAIKNFHPEILLTKTLISHDLAVLLSELYWYYQKSFVRFYLEIYCIDNCDLINSKCIAKGEIEAELERYRGHHFLRGFKITENKSTYWEYYFKLYNFPTTGYRRENNFRFQLLNVISYDKAANIRSFENLNVDSDLLLKEIDILINLLEEIDEFTITKTSNLKTNNINYLDHMSINYTENLKILLSIIRIFRN